MESAGEKAAHKRTGTSCIKTIPGNLFESTGDKVTAYSDGQYSGTNLLFENERGVGHKKLLMVCLCKHIWQLLLRKKVTVTALNKHADI